MIPDPLTFAKEALGCREHTVSGPWREVPDAEA